MNSIALKMLVGDTTKYISLIIGITFAALIMTQQPSIFLGLMTRTFGFIQDTSYPDIWVMDPQVRFIDDITPMQDTVLQQVRGIEGVRWATPMFKGQIRARMADGSFTNCIVVGIDATTMIGAPPVMVHGNIADLRASDAVVVNEEGANDKLARVVNGKKVPLAVGDTLELNDKRAIVVGIAQTSRAFQSQPLIYTTYQRAITFAPQERKLLSFVLAKVRDGENVQAVADRINQSGNLKALTQKQFQELTFNYFMKYTGIPINFGITVMLGFIIGAIITGQTFYAFTYDNLRQYAALKAMGARSWTLVQMVTLQAMMVGVIGWCMGVGLAAWFGWSTRKTILAFKMSPELFLFSGTTTLIIVIIAAGLAMMKVLRVDPALVFKG